MGDFSGFNFPALWSLRGLRPAQPTIADAVRNIFISTPISAMILAALSPLYPEEFEAIPILRNKRFANSLHLGFIFHFCVVPSAYVRHDTDGVYHGPYQIQNH